MVCENEYIYDVEVLFACIFPVSTERHQSESKGWTVHIHTVTVNLICMGCEKNDRIKCH